MASIVLEPQLKPLDYPKAVKRTLQAICYGKGKVFRQAESNVHEAHSAVVILMQSLRTQGNLSLVLPH